MKGQLQPKEFSLNRNCAYWEWKDLIKGRGVVVVVVVVSKKEHEDNNGGKLCPFMSPFSSFYVIA